ncbi:uncharacterized protein GBIM_02899 [Gryllus bimaculatus]|nr:uncharacterized protein GBIM_02899 [Gryllus bimaculatus]
MKYSYHAADVVPSALVSHIYVAFFGAEKALKSKWVVISFGRFLQKGIVFTFHREMHINKHYFLEAFWNTGRQQRLQQALVVLDVYSDRVASRRAVPMRQSRVRSHAPPLQPQRLIRHTFTLSHRPDSALKASIMANYDRQSTVSFKRPDANMAAKGVRSNGSTKGKGAWRESCRAGPRRRPAGGLRPHLLRRPTGQRARPGAAPPRPAPSRPQAPPHLSLAARQARLGAQRCPRHPPLEPQGARRSTWAPKAKSPLPRLFRRSSFSGHHGRPAPAPAPPRPSLFVALPPPAPPRRPPALAASTATTAFNAASAVVPAPADSSSSAAALAGALGNFQYQAVVRRHKDILPRIIRGPQANLQLRLQVSQELQHLRLDGTPFQNLTQLDVSENSIESLDLSALTKLESVQCSRNRLSELALNGKALVSLIAGNNRLQKLTISPAPTNLKHLDVSYNLNQIRRFSEESDLRRREVVMTQLET